MNSVKKVIDRFLQNTIWFIIILSIFAFYYPEYFSWMTKYTSLFLGVAMFGMGTTIKAQQFKEILLKPKEILIGILAQFIIMPLSAWLLCIVLKLPSDIAIGVILVGCCPGGTASNVITLLAKGDVALSVSMTTVSTFLAPFITPLLVYLFAGSWIDISLTAMLLTVVKVILIPVILGILFNILLGEKGSVIMPVMPLFSSISITLIIAAIIALNSSKIVHSGLLVASVVIIHNLLGLILALFIARVFKISYSKTTAIAIEVAMQNSGLAVSLATVNFATNPLASLPGALFSVWHNISGAVFAKIRSEKKYKN